MGEYVSRLATPDLDDKKQAIEETNTNGCKVAASVNKAVDYDVGENAEEADNPKSLAGTEAANRDEKCTISDIPDVALVHLFQYLPIHDLINLLKVCKRWNELIDPNDCLWRKFIPNTAGFVPLGADSAKAVVKTVWKNSIKIGKERWWFMDVSPAFENRMADLKIWSQWGYGGRYPVRAGATLYRRLNPTYDFIDKGNDPDNAEVLGAMKDIFEGFNKGQPYFDPDKDYYVDYGEGFQIENEKDVMEKSELLSYSEILDFVQDVLEPIYATKRRDLSGFSHLSEITVDIPVYENTGGDSEVDDDDVCGKMLEKHYTPPMLSTYKEIMGILVGDDDTKNARRFYLNDGCFNENFERAYEMLIGPNAVLYESRFYDL